MTNISKSIFLIGWLIFVVLIFTPIKNYSPFVFLPLFAFFGFRNLLLIDKFSKKIKNDYPEIFEKTKLYYGYYKDEWVNLVEINNDNFNKINGDSKSIYLDLKNNNKLLLFTFISFGLSGIIIVVLS